MAEGLRLREAEDVLHVETSESVAFRLELAGLGSRGLALLVDVAFLVAMIAGELIATLIVTLVLASTVGAFDQTWSLAIFAIVAFVTYHLYFVIGEWRGNGRTWGKKRVGLRTVRDDGSRIGLLDSVIRNLLRAIDSLPGMYGVGMASSLISRKGKRLGDLAAGTVVVRDRGELSLYFDGSKGPPLNALAKEYLERRAGFTPEARYQVATEILAAYGETPGMWDEPTIAGRLADLSGARSAQDESRDTSG